MSSLLLCDRSDTPTEIVCSECGCYVRRANRVAVSPAARPICGPCGMKRGIPVKEIHIPEEQLNELRGRFGVSEADLRALLERHSRGGKLKLPEFGSCAICGARGMVPSGQTSPFICSRCRSRWG